MRSLLSCPAEDVAFFLPQLVQMLRYDGGGLVEAALIAAAERSVYFAHLLICQLAAEGTPPDEAFSPLASGGANHTWQLLSTGIYSTQLRESAARCLCVQVKRSNWAPPQDTGLWAIADRVRAHVLSELHGPVRERLDAELAFFDDITDVSGKLYPIPKVPRGRPLLRGQGPTAGLPAWPVECVLMARPLAARRRSGRAPPCSSCRR